MTTPARHLRLGVFIVLGVLLIVGLVMALGGGGLFRDTLIIETYFNGSVQGLDVGSKVKYRGVLIGEVTKLGFTANRYQDELPPIQRKPYVYVEARLDLDQSGFDEDIHLIQDLIDKGLRVRMSAQGITGIYFLEFDYFEPERVPLLPIDWQPEHVYIPSGPSTVTQIIERAEEFLGAFKNINLAQTSENLNALLVKLNAKADALDLEAIGGDARATLADLRAASAQVKQALGDKQLERAVTDAAAASARMRKLLEDPALDSVPADAGAAAKRLREIAESSELEQAIGRLDSILSKIDGALGQDDRDLAVIVDNLRRTSENLRDFSESAKRYPGALFAQPPRRVNPTETQ